MTTAANCQSKLGRGDEQKNRVLPMCGHTFCLECLGQLLSRERGVITCPECRKTIRISYPFTTEVIDRELVTNAVAIPRKNSAITGSNNNESHLLPEITEIEERVPRDDFEEVAGKILPLSKHIFKRTFAYLFVLGPIIISILCQPAYVFPSWACVSYENKENYYSTVDSRVIITGLVLTIMWFFSALPLFVTLIYYKRNQRIYRRTTRCLAFVVGLYVIILLILQVFAIRNFSTYYDYLKMCKGQVRSFIIGVVGGYTSLFAIILRVSAKRTFYSVFPFRRLFSRYVVD